MACGQKHGAVELAGTGLHEVRPNLNAGRLGQVCDRMHERSGGGRIGSSRVSGTGAHHDSYFFTSTQRAPFIEVGNRLAGAIEAESVTGLRDCCRLPQHDEVIVRDVHHRRDLKICRRYRHSVDAHAIGIGR